MNVIAPTPTVQTPESEVQSPESEQQPGDSGEPGGQEGQPGTDKAEAAGSPEEAFVSAMPSVTSSGADTMDTANESLPDNTHGGLHGAIWQPLLLQAFK